MGSGGVAISCSQVHETGSGVNPGASSVGTRDAVYRIIRTLLEEQGRGHVDISDESFIQDGGLGFDSLTVAEFSAKLEEQFGRDPYTSGFYPSRICDLLGFYD